MNSKTSLIAVCGIDGAGKSTIVDMAKKRKILDDAIYLKKENAANSLLVKEYHRRKFGDGRDWISGSYAHSMGLAVAFDFLHHYDGVIKPWIGKKNYIVCDRYSLCYRAYLQSTGYPKGIQDMFYGVKPPDLIIYIQVPVAVAVERYAKRGGAGEDEIPEVMYQFEEAYQQLLPLSGCPVIQICNDRFIEETYHELEVQLKKHFREH